MNLYITDREGVEHILEATQGWKVMEVIREAGLPIRAECGGNCACATCHLYVDPVWFEKLEQIDEEEIDMLDEAFDVQDNSRLSCQIKVGPELDGFKATLAPDYD